MNGRVMLAGALGGLALFIWFSISWAVLPFHMQGFNGIAHNAKLDALMMELGAEPGLNYYPAQEEGASRADHATLARSVPGIGIMTYWPNGIDMNSPAPFIMGIIGCIIAALIVSQFFIVLPASAGFGSKVLFCAMFGVAAFFCTHWVNGNFFYVPMRALMLDLADQVIGWIIAGCVLAALLKSKAATTSRATA